MTDEGIVPLTFRKRQEIISEHDKLTQNALRVLALSKKDIAKNSNENTDENNESGMVFLGLAGMLDPPRAEAKRAVKLCRSAHIRTVMITGDHRNTAAATLL